jgi:hypothetical protein
LGERKSVLPTFVMTDDPEALTQFIHRCRDRGVRPEELLELLEEVTRRGSGNDVLTRRVSEDPSRADRSLANRLVDLMGSIFLRNGDRFVD